MDNLTLGYVLIGTGMLLLAAELFIPSGGALLVAAVTALGFGVGMTFYYGSALHGVLTVIGLLVALPLLGAWMVHYWPKTRVGRRMLLMGDEEDAAAAARPASLELEALRGRLGQTVSVLRPSGFADFDGRRVDVISEGLLVEVGQWVRCIDVKDGRVIVRPVEKPPGVADLENMDLT